MGLYDTTQIANIVPEVWSAKYYDVLRTSLVFQECINSDWEGEIKKLGDTINITEIEDFDDATELAEGAQGTTEATTLNNNQLVINKRTYKDYKITSRADLQSLPFMDKLRDKAIFSILKRVQQLIIDTISPSTATPDHTDTYDAGSTLALTDLLSAKEALDDIDLPDEDRFMVLDAPQWNDLFNITGFTSRDFVPSGSPLSTAQFQNDILGFIPRKTTAASAVSYFFHRSFMTMAMQQELNIEVHNLGASGERSFRCNNDILWGLQQLDNTRVYTIS